MNLKTYKFYKNDFGWLIDLPEWEGEVWDLQVTIGRTPITNVKFESIKLYKK